MEETLYKIVFKGEVGFDYDQDEVRENLRTHCGFDPKVIDRLFSGGAFVLKKDIDEVTANKYREALHRQGALCDIVPMSPPIPSAAPQNRRLTPAASTSEKGAFKCPACGHEQEKGDACSGCGIYFAKYERMQARRAQEKASTPDTVISADAVAPCRQGTAPPGSIAVKVSGSSELIANQQFLQQCALVILTTAFLQSLLGSDLMIVGFVLLPFAFLLYLLFQVMVSGQYLVDLLEEHLAFEAVRYEEGATKDRLPRVTFSVILLNLILYYGLVIPLGPEALVYNFAFLPESPNLWNVPLSALSAPFLHSGGWQLWGSLVFLWIVGTVVENRIGMTRFLVSYLLTAMFAGGVGALLHRFLLGAPLHGLGSSGAIAGLIGVSVICCSSRRMQFFLPIIGQVSSTDVKIWLNPLIVIGLFFFSNLSGGIDRSVGWTAEAVGHLVNMGGMLGGMLFGMFFDPESLNGNDRMTDPERSATSARLPQERT